MTNSEIAKPFKALADVMEYVGEDTFKIRSYTKAYDTIRKSDQLFSDMSLPELKAVPGIGDAIAKKVISLNETGSLALLETYREQLSAGVFELLSVRGLGPKKVKQVIAELEVDSVGELLQAIQENRLSQLKGFGAKTQEKLRKQLEFHQHAQGFARWADVEVATVSFLKKLASKAQRAEVTGEFARQCPVLTEVTFLSTGEAEAFLLSEGFVPQSGAPDVFGGTINDFPARVRLTTLAGFPVELIRATSSAGFLSIHPTLGEAGLQSATSEDEVFAKASLSFVPAPQRESGSPYPATKLDDLITLKAIKGIVHAHTTWSDGATELPDLVNACRERGYEYLTITDHSKSAGYAGGLSIERLLAQLTEVRKLDAHGGQFRTFAGTECDILGDGRLDYPDEILEQLDIVVASVHSSMNMDAAAATHRIITAISNPNVDILGHPTGRLLLSRAGYPLDMLAILDACAEYGVAIELNASPYRLDLDWTYIQAAVERGVLISINPDAHSIGGLDNVRFGVLAAQKGGLRPQDCLNTKSAAEFAEWLADRRGLSL